MFEKKILKMFLPNPEVLRVDSAIALENNINATSASFGSAVNSPKDVKSWTTSVQD